MLHEADKVLREQRSETDGEMGGNFPEAANG